MKGKVIKVSNFSSMINWLFIIEDEKENIYYIMDKTFYDQNKLKSPVTFRDLDSLDVNFIIDFDFIEIDNRYIITKFHW
jgi:hypothetical protein